MKKIMEKLYTEKEGEVTSTQPHHVTLFLPQFGNPYLECSPSSFDI